MTMARDRLQRLAALRREGILTDAEYEAKRAALIDEALDAPTHEGRNIGHVLLGALGGFVLGLAFIGALLVFVPREKRADRLFGAWLGTAAGGLALIALVMSLAATSGSSTSAVTSLYSPRDVEAVAFDAAGRSLCFPVLQGARPQPNVTEVSYLAPTLWESGNWMVGCRYIELCDTPTCGARIERHDCVYVDGNTLAVVAVDLRTNPCGMFKFKYGER